MPPTAIRRPVTITVWLLVSSGFVLLFPLLLAVGAAVSAITGRPQPLVLARLTLAYFMHELAVLVACGALWVATGGSRLVGTSRWQLLHWRVLGWLIANLAAAGRRTLGIRVRPEASPEAIRALEADRPLIVFSRHAGPGDTIFVTNELISRYRRRPSVAFKEKLALDPCVDLLAHRLPQALLDTSDRNECEARIRGLTAELGPRGTFLLFPEGGNFTPERRSSALRRLWRKGRRRSAARAEEMPHVLPPQPGGALAALRARADADVVFAAHTGLGLAAYPRQFWRDIPIGRTLHTRLWLVPAEEVPEGDEQRVSWLYDWWERIDAWIDGPHPDGVEPENA
jgi:1-acyl-sn-glycerol-3-phosphate acyltransferase